MPTVRIVTAARDADAFLADTIDSIRCQTFTDWRYTIVDDASSDGTYDLAQEAAAVDDRIEVVRLDAPRGAYGAANEAMRGADCKYFARIDADDLALPDRLERQVQLLASSPQAVASAGAWRSLSNQGVGRVRRVPTAQNGSLKWMMFFRSGLVHSTLMIEADAFRSFGMYGPERVAEDFRLWAKVIRSGGLAVTDAPLVQYRFSDHQVTAEFNARDQPARLRIRAEHMNACAGGGWSEEDARDLRYVGRTAPFGVRRATMLIDRWEKAWRDDHSLTSAERGELGAYAAALRLRHFRGALKRRAPEVALAAMSRPVQTATALARIRGSEIRRWT